MMKQGMSLAGIKLVADVSKKKKKKLKRHRHSPKPSPRLNGKGSKTDII